MPDLKSPNNIDSEKEAKQFNRNHHSSEAHLVINKAIATILGLDEAVFLGDLLSKEKYFEDHKMLDDQGYFFNSEDNREKDTGLSPYRQSKAIEKLEQLEILYPVLRKGSPPKQKFKLNHSILKSFYELILKNSYELILKNLRINNNNKSQSQSQKKELKSKKDFRRVSAKPSPKKTSSTNFIQPQTGEYAVLCSWNKLPSPASAHIKLDTKTVKCVAEFIRQMRNGVFGDPSRRRWDGKWLDKHKIDPQVFAEKKWTIREICQIIEGPLADMYKDGYWPQNKDRLPKSLAGAFYNPRTQTSFFIQAAYDSPGRLKNIMEQNPYPDVTEVLIKEGILDLKQMKADDWKRYLEGIRSLAKYLEDIDWTNYGARQMFPGGRSGNPYSLIMHYVKWLKGSAPDICPPRSMLPQIHAGMIRSDFWGWQEFMKSTNLYWKQVFCSIPYEEN